MTDRYGSITALVSIGAFRKVRRVQQQWPGPRATGDRERDRRCPAPEPTPVPSSPRSRRRRRCSASAAGCRTRRVVAHRCGSPRSSRARSWPASPASLGGQPAAVTLGAASLRHRRRHPDEPLRGAERCRRPCRHQPGRGPPPPRRARRLTRRAGAQDRSAHPRRADHLLLHALGPDALRHRPRRTAGHARSSPRPTASSCGPGRRPASATRSTSRTPTGTCRSTATCATTPCTPARSCTPATASPGWATRASPPARTCTSNCGTAAWRAGPSTRCPGSPPTGIQASHVRHALFGRKRCDSRADLLTA